MVELSFLKGHLKHLILKAIEKKPLHGYEIIKEISHLTQGVWKPTTGALYPSLSSMVEEKLVSMKNAVVDGRARKVYSITEKGKKYHAEKANKINMLHDRIVKMHRDGVLKTKPSDDIAGVLDRFDKLVGEEIHELGGTLFEYMLLHKEGKISKKNEVVFKKKLREFLEATKEINTQAKS